MVADTMKAEDQREVEPLRVNRDGKRFFGEAYKRAVVEKCLAPGASVSAVALAHKFNANLVRKWIAKYQTQQAIPRAARQLMPVRVIEANAPARRSARDSSSASTGATSGAIEIEIGAARVRLHGAVDVEQLRAVFEALGTGR
jgi:transposase